MITLAALILSMIACLFGVLVGVFSLKIDIENFNLVSLMDIARHVGLTVAFGATFTGLFIGTQLVLQWGS